MATLSRSLAPLGALMASLAGTWALSGRHWGGPGEGQCDLWRRLGVAGRFPESLGGSWGVPAIDKRAQTGWPGGICGGQRRGKGRFLPWNCNSFKNAPPRPSHRPPQIKRDPKEPRGPVRGQNNHLGGGCSAPGRPRSSPRQRTYTNLEGGPKHNDSQRMPWEERANQPRTQI